jgi:hypothetical protein
MRSVLFPAALLFAGPVACSSPAPAAVRDAGVEAAVEAAAPPPGPVFKYKLNGTIDVASDKNVGAVIDGDHTLLTGSFFNEPTRQTFTVGIDLYNVTAAGTYKCSDNLDPSTKKPWTSFTYNRFTVNDIDPMNPTGKRIIEGDCTVVITAWAGQKGAHFVGTFTVTHPQFDMTDGAFDLTRP